MLYTHDLPVVIFGLIISGSFFMSAMAASGNPQFATGPKSAEQNMNLYNLSHTQNFKLQT